MAERSLERLKRTRAAQRLKRLGQRPEWSPSRLSVVVPFFDSASGLAACLDSLLAQTHAALEVVLVDDGSGDGSRDIARRYVDEQPGFCMVEQAHRGVAAARDAGVRRASGPYLAFCDADDEVPPAAYARAVSALEKSGSDLAVASVAIQNKGLYREPAWARRSNSGRRLGVGLEDTPEIMANLMPGTRVFRRSSWDAAGCTFAEAGDRGDTLTIVRAMLAARSFDVLTGVGYRWTWRDDGRSLLQRDLMDRDRARERIASMRAASQLLAECAPEPAQQHFLAQALRTSAELVRAAVYQDEGYWQVLSGELRLLMDHAAARSLQHVPVVDRVATWLCAQDDREATEAFLEYAADHVAGFPFAVADGRARIIVPVADSLEAGADLTRVAEVDLCFRTRLTELAWEAPGILRLEGAALVEYTRGTIRHLDLVLRERDSGEELNVPTRPVVSSEFNRWAARPHEDHSEAGFAARIDVASLQCDEAGPTYFDVKVRLEVDGLARVGPLQSRRSGGSPGLFEVSTRDGLAAGPAWSGHRGLSLTVRRPSGDQGRMKPLEASPVLVHALSADDDVLTLTGSATTDFELALVGAHSRTPWATPTRTGAGFTAQLPVLADAWGQGQAPLPRDQYSVMTRLADGTESGVRLGRALWRALPPSVDSGRHLLYPSATGVDGVLTLRVVPGEDRDSGSAYLRRHLSDTTYPAAREEPLLRAVLLEAFAGRSAGDNPRAICEELARRETDLDLVVSVVDRSVRVPAGSRPVMRWSTEWFELIGRASYVVINAALPRFVCDRPGQVLLQTWHGSPLKRIAHDRLDVDFADWRHRRQLLVAQDSWNFLISQSPFCTAALRSAFRYGGEVLEVGYPRNDILVAAGAEDVRRRTRDHLGIPEDARAVLYAPTWRDNKRAGRVYDKVLHLDATSVVERLENSVVLVRGHYNSMGAAEEHALDRRIMDVTRYPDISELYLAADALVTDYSSVFFDFVLTDKPMFFLAPDLAEYRDESRGFYLDYHDTVPGPVCLSTGEVIDALQCPDELGARRAEFRREFTPHDDGHASRRVVDALLRRTPTENQYVAR